LFVAVIYFNLVTEPTFQFADGCFIIFVDCQFCGITVWICNMFSFITIHFLS